MIVVFGSLVLDLVMAADRLPRPGETVLTDAYRMLPGGKGANQALAAARAGAAVRFLGRRGSDAFAGLALANLDDAGIDLSGVGTSSRPTACAAVCVDADGGNQIVVASGANLDVDVAQLAAAPPGLGDVCLMQMEIPAAQTWAAIELAHQRGARTVLNVAPYGPVPAAALRRLDVLIVNEIEAEAMAADHGLAAAGLADVARRLSHEHGLTVVATLGRDGALAVADGRLLFANALHIEARDTVGAGDAFVGAFAAAFAEGLPLADCLRRGNVAGGLACLTPGAQDGIPTRAEIETRLGEIQIT